MNYKINWNDLTEEEAQEIANVLIGKFNIRAKCYGSEKHHDVSYLTICGEYDDKLHATEIA